MYRTFYAERDTTIYEKEPKRNTGIDQILELTKIASGSKLNGIIQQSQYNSRILIDFGSEITTLTTAISNGEIPSWNNSNITWHYDDGYKYGTTFYLNKYWDKDWGGELLLKDNTFIKPEPNRLVIIKTPYEHKTCITSPDAPNRLTIQTFI